MRIGAINQVTSVYGPSSVKKTYGANGANTANSIDKVSFSNIGKDIHVAKAALANVPDVREDKVNAIKEQIANGTYSVSPESFADKLMSAFADKTI